MTVFGQQFLPSLRQLKPWTYPINMTFLSHLDNLLDMVSGVWFLPRGADSGREDELYDAIKTAIYFSSNIFAARTLN